MVSKYIPEESINEIRYQADIVDVISRYVILEKSGKNYKGLCPFHKEKTPSFVVSPTKQIFRCYGCGVGGNVFTFLMQHEKYTFPEAVRFLAGQLGIELPERGNAKTAQQLKRSDVLYQLHHEAAQYFSEQLTQSEQGKYVRDYLKNRGIDERIIQKFSLGYALPAWDGLRKAFIGKHSPELLLESGLLVKRKSGVGHYDRFRDRLIIPIYDGQGRIVAFGGRILGEGEPKYLNSPESSIFHKSRTLFGLHHAKTGVRQMGSILIVEGYFDMIVPYSYGIENIAATMGTALTEYHLRQLQRYTKKVILVFDADPAGMKAVLRTLDLFLTSGVEGRAVVLPKGEDPDSAIRKNGLEKFRAYIDQAPLLLDFVRDRIVERYDLSQVEQQIECAKAILPILVKIRDLVERNVQINRTADILKISDRALLQEFKKVIESGKIRFSQATPRKQMTIPRLEQYLIKALIKDKRLIPEIREMFDPTELSHPISQKILEELYVYGNKTDFEAKVFDIFQETEVQQELSELLMKTEEIQDPARTVWDCIKTLRQKRFDQATLDVTWRVRNAQEKKHAEVLDTCLEQKNKDLLRKKHDNLEKKGKI